MHIQPVYVSDPQIFVLGFGFHNLPDRLRLIVFLGVVWIGLDFRN